MIFLYGTIRLVKNPNHEAVYEYRSGYYIKKKKFDLAKKDLDKALEITQRYNLKPRNVFNGYGILYYEIGDYPRALENFNLALQYNEEFYEAYLNRGNLYHRIGKYDLAIEDYSRSLELYPRLHIEPYNNRGAIYAAKGSVLNWL